MRKAAKAARQPGKQAGSASHGAAAACVVAWAERFMHLASAPLLLPQRARARRYGDGGS
jgi:hypothetical protein